MTATATPMEAAVQKLVDQGATLGEAVESLKKTLEKPDYSALRPHAGQGTFGYWGEGETIVAAVPEGGPQPIRKSFYTLPKGYANKHWATAGDFYREGFSAKKSGNMADFNAKYGSIFKAVQGMSAQVGTDGAYGILPEFNQKIIERTYANDLLGRTDQYTVNNNMIFLANAETSRATGSRHGGMRGYWLDEGAAATKSKPTFRRIEISLKKVAVLVYLTEELLSDGGLALEQYVARKAAEEFNFMIGDAIFNGSGIGLPLGILNSPAFLAITKESGQSAATIYTENIDKMWARRFASGNYSFYGNQDVHPQLAGLSRGVGAAGDLVYNPPGGLSAAPYATLKGAPVVDTEFNATLGTVGDLLLADLSQYITINKGGITQAVSTEVEFLTDQTALKFTMRMNGRPWETTPTTPYKGSNTQASFLGIETRS